MEKKKNNVYNKFLLYIIYNIQNNKYYYLILPNNIFIIKNNVYNIILLYIKYYV